MWVIMYPLSIQTLYYTPVMKFIMKRRTQHCILLHIKTVDVYDWQEVGIFEWVGRIIYLML